MEDGSDNADRDEIEEGDDSNEGNGNEDNRQRDYAIGYCKPPRHSQFPKGQSGNPKGRKKGSRGLKKDLDAALRATLTITINGKKHKGTTQALAMYGMAVRAAAGDLKAQKLLADLVLSLFGPGDRGGGEAKLSRTDQAMLDRFLGQPIEAGSGEIGDSAESRSEDQPACAEEENDDG